ncbi:MAG: DUF4878 domain-containing protein [Hydrogenobacter sp.]
MKKVAIGIALVLLAFFVVRSCKESPQDEAKQTVKEFVSAIKDRDGEKAVKLLYPPFRDALVQNVKLPIEITEMKPSELLACILSSMGKNIKSVKYLDTKKIDDQHVEVLVKVIDKEGIEKLFSFILIKDEKRWRIASIASLR